MKTRFFLSVLSIVLLTSSQAIYSQQSLWVNPTIGSWPDPANWAPTLPDATTQALILNGGTATLSSGEAGTTSNLLIGAGVGGDGSVVIS